VKTGCKAPEAVETSCSDDWDMYVDCGVLWDNDEELVWSSDP